MTTKVLNYWCEPADEESAYLLTKQLELGSEYAKELDRAENLRRHQYRNRLLQYQEFYLIDNRISQLYGSTVPEDRDDSFWSNIKLLKTERTKVYKIIKDMQSFKDCIDADQTKYNDNCKTIRNNLGPRGSGLSFATYQLEEDAHRQSKMTRAQYLPILRKRNPKEGIFAVHCQFSNDRIINKDDREVKLAGKPRVTVADVWHGHCQEIRIDSEKYGISRTKGARGVRRRDDNKTKGCNLQLVTLKVSGRGPSAKYLRVHALIHRVPVSGTVSWAKVHVTRVATKIRYSLHISVDNMVTEDSLNSCPSPTGDVIGIDLGWRQVDAGFLIATARNQDGSIPAGVYHNDKKVSELIIPKEVIQRALPYKGEPSRCATLRSTRDKNFNDLINKISEAKKTSPPWFNLFTQHCSRWRSPSRICNLLSAWRDQRWDGDVDLYNIACEFIKQDRHLWNWEANNRAKMARQIRGRFQAWADSLSKVYRCIKIENLDFKQAAIDFRKQAEAKYEKDNNKSKSPLIDKRATLQLAHVGHALIRSCTRNQRDLGRVEKRGTSRNCEICHEPSAKTMAKVMVCKKKSCALYNQPVDRDNRAARNIANGSVLEYLTGPLAPVKDKKSQRNPRRRKTIGQETALT